MKKLLFLIVFLTAIVGKAQIPGRSLPSMLVAASQTNIGNGPLVRPGITPVAQTGSAIAEAITPDIQALAGNLGNNPVSIFNYVHDQIRYVHYFGSKKGAELTLLERSGNDFDQCALLSALLQASGYSPTYQFANMEIPYDAPNQQDLHHWWGLSLVNSNYANTYAFMQNFLGDRGYWIWGTSDSTNTFYFQRVWLALTISGTTYYLDPSFKVNEAVAGINLSNAMSLNTNTLWTAAGGTETASYVSGLNEGSFRSALQTCNSNLLNYISNNLPNASVAQVIGGQQIVSSAGLPLATNLLFPIYTNSTYPLLNWTNEPANFMGTVSIAFAGTNATWYSPQLEGQRLSLTFSNNGVAQLWLEDSQILSVTHPSSSNTVNVASTITHPYGGWSTSSNSPIDTGAFDESYTNAYKTTNSTYALTYSYEANQAWLVERQKKLNAYVTAGYTNGSRQVTSETLNVMGLSWMVQAELIEELLSQIWGQLPQTHHLFGRMAQEAGNGYYIDIFLDYDGIFPRTGYSAPDLLAHSEAFDVSSYFLSAIEHGIIEQLQSSNIVGASTVKMIEIAATNSNPIYMANSANWSTVRNSIANYGSLTNTLSAYITDGYTLLLPQNGNVNVNGAGTWSGSGYVVFGTNASGYRFDGMLITGDYSGGYSSLPGTIDTLKALTPSFPTFYNPQLATFSLAPIVGADPVNMVDGTFQITSVDMAIGQEEPRGLNFTRYYSSERINSNPAGMAPGWLHSYYCNATPLSNPEAGLGAETVEQMTPMVVALYAALNIYNNVVLDQKNWAATVLAAKWGIDQLTKNAVSVNLGNQTIQFVRQPNGTYVAPANCNMSLILTNSSYWLQERHGRTFKFSTNTVLTNIVDQYGQSMKFSYNASNFVTNVTDWANRSLTFNYSGGFLTSVTDNTGRSILYGYTNGELTYYSDPEQKTTTYAYDTTNELVATFDGLGNLVVSNNYDGFGHVTTQLTEGNPSKTWQIYASGFYTLEIDPSGDEQIYTYDDQARLIAFQDGMDNVTQTIYDGQSHVIQTISPLNETNQFIYDGSNNLIAAIDPLGYSNTFTFDANNNLVASIDKRGKVSHFGYNGHFGLVGSTNGNGDYYTLAYNANGTLQSRTDSGGTTTYAYDSDGTLNSITYPSSLGSESLVNSTLGDPTSHTDVRGFTTTYAYNNRRQLTNTVAPTNVTIKATFDANANTSTITDARGYVTSNNWSTTRKLLTTTLPATPQGTPVITRAYDNRDWLASTQNPLGNTTYYTNDAAQRLVATTDPLRRATSLTYDADSHQLSASDAAGDTTTQFWNARGDLKKVIDAATNTVGKAYDAAGNLIFLTNRDNNVWQFQYDGANRLTNTISPLSHSSSRVYNNRGLLQSSTDAMSQTTSYSYDARGRMTTKTDNVGVNNYTYDGNNNLTVLTKTGGPSLSWVYDAYNHPISCTTAAGYLIQYLYDRNGNITNLIYPGNLTVKYYYDSNNRLTNVTDWNGRQTVMSYDLAGHLTSVTRPNSTVRTMSYDADGELTNIVDQTTGKYPICFYTLNYSLAGRVQWEFKAPLPHSNAPPTRTMTYDADNRLSTFNSTNVTVDNDGRLTYGPGTNSTFVTYAYDARSEPTSAGGISYGYDPAGNRTSFTNGSTVTTFVVNPQGSQVLMRISAGTTNYYIYGGGLSYEIDVAASSTTEAYYHFDSRGSTITLTDPNGNPTDIVEYSSYGTTTYRYGSNTTPFLFNGQYGVQTDPNGLLYMRARYYNPYISRFINADPSGFNGGFNFYAFCNDNPINLEDPYGLFGFSTMYWANLSVTGSWWQEAIAVPLGILSATVPDAVGVSVNGTGGFFNGATVGIQEVSFVQQGNSADYSFAGAVPGGGGLVSPQISIGFTFSIAWSSDYNPSASTWTGQFSEGTYGVGVFGGTGFSSDTWSGFGIGVSVSSLPITASWFNDVDYQFLSPQSPNNSSPNK